MQKNSTQKTDKRLVLVGGGHAHVVVLKAFAMRPMPGVGITLIARELDAPYSGMLPGYVAGHYSLEECHIDLVRLAQFAGARVIEGDACDIDRTTRRVSITGRPAIAYDVLSIDTGITPDVSDIDGALEHAIAVKPVSRFAPQWKALETRALKPDGPRRITVIGTGAAGFELVLAIRHRLRTEAPRHGIRPDAFSFALIGSGAVLATHNRRARDLAAKALRENEIELVAGDAAVAVGREGVRLASGKTVPSEATLITTKAQPPEWFGKTGLPLDGPGYIAVRPTLQVLDDEDVFAVGDCANVLEHRREKAGVFAVRQGPPLADNLRLRLSGRQARPFKPQRQFLTLLSCGDKTAIAARGPFAAAGAWAWQLKDLIDRAFMRKFQVLPTLEPVAGEAAGLDCAGCAAKLGPLPLASALSRLAGPPDGLTIRDLSPRDDAAVLDLGGDSLRVETVDFFPAIWPEPYVLGEIAASHALGDVAAMGARADHALAIAGIPDAAPHLAEDDLFQLLAGARAVLDREGIALVGGHTSRSPELSAGFFVSGKVARERILAKGGLMPGDALILTKPLGTGIIFAGWMRGLAAAREVRAALAGMRETNSRSSSLLADAGCRALTDITGFGLAGHLVEMLEASGTQGALWLDAIPRYSGADRLLELGVRSSLIPDNLGRMTQLELAAGLPAWADALIFDPQTSGGLLAGLAHAQVDRGLADLAAAGIEARVVGRVGEMGLASPKVLRMAESATG